MLYSSNQTRQMSHFSAGHASVRNRWLLEDYRQDGSGSIERVKRATPRWRETLTSPKWLHPGGRRRETYIIVGAANNSSSLIP